MDFGSLLHVAKRNSVNDQKSESTKFYPAKFSAPKKESKEKKLSANIQKFLKKRDEEEREKARIAKQKLDDLMAMRDEKAKNKIKKMLKVTKSANKSVLEDAIDNDNTAYTLQGPEQPDEDDYGYTSQEASQLYKSLMDKYKKVPEEKTFSASRPSKKDDLIGTKDRVRAALQREQEEENGPHRRKRNTTTETNSSSKQSIDERPCHRRKNIYDPESERREEEERKRNEQRAKTKNRPPPPSLDFQQLLQLAEKKQHEPLEVEVQIKAKEAERLLTKKEKRENEERQRYFAEKEQRKKNRNHPEVRSKDVAKADPNGSTTTEPRKMEQNGRIPKIGSKPASQNLQKPNKEKRPLNGISKQSSSDIRKTSMNNTDSQPNRDRKSGLEFCQPTSNSSPSSSSSQSRQLSSNTKPLPKSSSIPQKPQANIHKNPTACDVPHKDIRKPINSKDSKPFTINRSPIQERQSSIIKTKTVPQNNNNNNSNTKTRPFPSQDVKTRQFPPADLKSKNISSADVKSRQFPPADIKSRQYPPVDVKSRPFPPTDVKTRKFPPDDMGPRQFSPADMRRAGHMKKPLKRRQVIDDDDSEYDSEMDDFIDDGPEEQDYSKYIKEIFGYDKSKYRGMDDDVDNMESSFAQQMKEEYVSKKIGLMEDLEDMRMEAEEKKRKKKRRKLSESD